MNILDLPAAAGNAPTTTVSPDVFQQLGLITRQLHDTLSQLGVLSKLQQTAHELSDSRSRLNYITRKTGEAAEKVLNAVDLAKQEQAVMTGAAARLAHTLAEQPERLAGEAGELAALVETSAARVDHYLTEIMLAQDFHDLTGQVVAKVVATAIDLEDSLVKLLVQVVPPEQREKVDPSILNGPVVDAAGRTDVVTNQGEVDDLLASLGF
jgi:chemotaxis protein CheZ